MVQMFDDKKLEDALPKTTWTALTEAWRACEEAERRGGSDFPALTHAKNNLIKWAQQRSQLPLYAEYIDKKGGELFLLSSIWSDGFGDYFALLRAASALQRHHKALSVQVVFHHKQPLPPVDYKQFGLFAEQIHAFRESDDPISHILEPVIEGCGQLLFEKEYEHHVNERLLDIASQDARVKRGEKRNPILDCCIEEASEILAVLEPYFEIKKRAQELRRRMEKARALVHIALALNTFSDEKLRRKSLYFSESGNFQGIENSFKLQWYSMGFLAFEEGLFLPRPSERYDAWDSQQLREFWKIHSPEPGKFYLGYFSIHLTYTAKLFIYFLSAWCREQQRDLLLFIPIASIEALGLDKEWLKMQEIAEIVHYKHGGIVEHMKLSESTAEGRKKILRIVNYFPLSPADFSRLLKESGSIVGCTGDGTLGECIAADKLPFYEVRRHKQQNYQGLLELTHAYSGNTALLAYLKNSCEAEGQLPEQLAEQLAHSANDPQLFSSWKLVVEVIKKHFDFERSLLGHVNRHLYNQSVAMSSYS